MAPRRRGLVKKPIAPAPPPRLTHVPPSTQWHRDHGRPSRKDKAIAQQYLTPQEEKVLTEEVLRLAENGYRVRVKSLPIFAQIIARQRSSAARNPEHEDDIKPPTKGWAQRFCKRNDLTTKKLKAVDWKRNGPDMYEKVAHWFEIMERELNNPNVLPENVYNMDETGCQLSAPGSVTVLVSKHDRTNSRGAIVKRESVTVVECVSADGRALPPTVVWPASTHRSTWMTYETPDWHFGLSENGYVDTAISLYWIRKVFDPWTRDQAKGKPRVLINDGFGTHETFEVVRFCVENNIILCRLPSNTSHLTQPCDQSIFSSLKAAYRDQVDQLDLGGAGTVGKEHFPQLYDQARRKAFTPRTIRSSWSKVGLFPLNPEKILQNIPRPQNTEVESQPIVPPSPPSPVELVTPVTSEGLNSLFKRIERVNHLVDDESRRDLQTLNNAALGAIASKDILRAQNELLRKQNDERKVRKSVKSKVIGTAKVMSYRDLKALEEKRDAKDAAKKSRKQKTKNKSKVKGKSRDVQGSSRGGRSLSEEAEQAAREMKAKGLADYCSVLQF